MSRPARVRFVFVAAVLAAGAGAAIYFFWLRSGREPVPVPAADAPPSDPRLTFDTPFRNVRPEVQYVGDAACAPCHQDLCDTFHRHAMGRSAILTSDPPDGVDKYDPAAPPRFSAFGHIDYQVDRRGDHFVHTELVKDPSGTELVRTEAAVIAGLGSGTRGRSYLCARDGTLWQSGVSWFSEKQVWDVSPGFYPGRHGLRPLSAGCLFCHVNRVEPVAGTINRYKEPFFGKQAAIGCERCHGPGELHVKEQVVTNGVDTSIVNPRHLPADLREDICRQCHLQGAQRIDRRGVSPFDYRPGLPLSLFMAVFVKHPSLMDYHKSVGQVEQTAVSKCAQASGGKFGCTSCHDPHSSPAPAVKDRYYRNRCLTCHKEADCHETLGVRQAKNDACTTCHMTKAASANIAHTAVTDHRILRQPAPSKSTSHTLAAGEMPIVPFAGYNQRGPDADEQARDLGIALSIAARARPDDSALVAEGRRLLQQAAERHPSDSDVWEALSAMLSIQGEWAESVRAAQAAVAAAPRKEAALLLAAEAALRGRQLELGLEYARRAVQVNPDNPETRLRLGQALADNEKFEEGEAELRAVLKVAPNHGLARTTLAICLFRQGKAREALAEQARAVAIDSQRGPELRELFNRQTR